VNSIIEGSFKIENVIKKLMASRRKVALSDYEMTTTLGTGISVKLV
jgi:hypothetical protein